jgi:C1A family cysteine protease
MVHSYGWKPDLPDQRDHSYLAPYATLQALPTSVDLREDCPAIEDQLNLGSCTSFAAGAAIRFARKKQGLSDFVTSHLFLYYNSRRQKSVDSGAYIRDVMKTASKQGDCPELEWPYEIERFAIKPPAQCYKDALLDRVLSYQRVARDLNQMKACLASGWPFIGGISVYASFESQEVARTGIVPMPGETEDLLGGHAIAFCGYDTAKGVLCFRNSWGDSWGDKGYGYIPFAYLMDKGLSADFWTIRIVGA